ncbi:hypothetical protein BDP81DRAFT_433681 [Colletotrichum phormii]|uniref:Secreted protein n=1 Tax=Colletotrichum phormii TaxID=359342 RepID=A0AAI9ZLZ0_9PEZI|nr:uncharacterized protein BDP81DRAFT_433681 [Colletotrichum phormii]KAK1634101.1 hypothetical protein BDP81DRAFT_433681 [Colletotrichum phormii]
MTAIVSFLCVAVGVGGSLGRNLFSCATKPFYYNEPRTKETNKNHSSNLPLGGKETLRNNTNIAWRIVVLSGSP